MAITSGASDGIRMTTAAKESAGNASTLGSQTGAAADQIIVPDAITANNEGNLESTPVYPGRLIALRPWEMKLTSATLAAAGSSYVATDVLTLSGGAAGPGGAPQITVDAVDGGGAITAFSITREASFAIRQGGMTSAPSPPTDPVSHTGGTGTGATFNCVFAPHFEVRLITDDASNTLTVSEPWDTAPASGDNWAVAYIPADAATATGLTFRSQSGVYEATRRLRVGPSTDGTRHGWFFLGLGDQIELDNAADNTFHIEDGGVAHMGYEQAGTSVGGGIMSDSGGAPGITSINAGSMLYVRDSVLRFATSTGQVADLTSQHTSAGFKFKKEVGNIIADSKMFRLGNNYAHAMAWQNNTLATIASTDVTPGGSFDFFGGIDIYIEEGAGYLYAPDVDGLTITVGNPQHHGIRVLLAGSHLRDTGGTESTTYIKNVFFSNQMFYVEQDEGIITKLANPTFGGGLTLISSDDAELGDFKFLDASSPSTTEHAASSQDTECGVIVARSVDLTAIGVDGTALSGLSGYTYDGLRYGGLFADGTAAGDANGVYAGFLFVAEYTHGLRGDILMTDIFQALPAVAESKWTIEFQGGSSAWKGYVYGRLPQLVVQPDVYPADGVPVEGVSGTVVFPIDTAITAGTAAAALSNPTTNPTVTRHGIGETDTRPMKAMNYDAGTGGVAPSLGETITGGTSGATGVVVEVVGDDTSGTILMDTWNGTEFNNDENITGGTSAFDATSHTSGGGSFYKEFTWEVDGKGEAGTIIYDYLAARMAESPVTAEFEPVIEWGANDADGLQLMFSGTSGYFTNRVKPAHRLRPALPLPTADFSDDFNRADEDLNTSANWEDVDNFVSAGNDVLRVVSNAVQGPGTGVDDRTVISGVTTTAHTFSNDYYVKYTPTPVNGDPIGVVARIDTVNDVCYGILHWWDSATNPVTGSAEYYENLVKIDFSDSNGAIIVYILGRVPIADVIDNLGGVEVTWIIKGQQHIILHDNVEVLRATDKSDWSTSGQPGIIAPLNGTDAHTAIIEDFSAGDVVDADFRGEGVWVHDRGGGTFNYFTSDDGTQFTIPATTTVTFTGIKDNTEVRVYLTGTTTEVAGTENATTGTTDDRSFAWSADASTVVDYVLINVAGWQILRVNGYVVPSSNTSLPIQQVVERNYSNP
jgi:hypothetical protein